MLLLDKKPTGDPMRSEWTDNRRKVADFLTAYIRTHGRSPSLDEIATGTGLWKRSVEIVLKGLEKIGFIELTPGISRGIRLKGGDVRRVPLFGTVRAGAPALAQETPPEFLRIRPDLVPFQNPVALRVEGFSMRDAGILPGDIVLLRPQPEARHGETVVAWYNGGMTVKTLEYDGTRLHLRPANPAFKAVEVQADDDFRILGRVMLVLRDLAGCIDLGIESAEGNGEG
jgi:repressor LexA